MASLQAQLEQRRREAEQKDKLYQSLSEETENLKNKFAALSARCQALEKQDPVALQVCVCVCVCVIKQEREIGGHFCLFVCSGETCSK